jgi:hypothetical protein
MRDVQCCNAAKYVAMHNSGSYIHGVPKGGLTGAGSAANPKGTEMFENLKKRIAKRARYNRMVSEINGLTERDLADFNGDRTEMLRAVYLDVYGR